MSSNIPSQLDPQTQQQQQPPVSIYPNSVARLPPSSSSSSSHSDNGSFGTVFIVLAVIVVVSGIACCLGRLCNKRVNKSKPPKQSHGGFRPKDQKMREKEKERDFDLEFGFDKNIAASKPAGKGEAPNGIGFEFKPAGKGEAPNGKGSGFKPLEKGQHINFEPKGQHIKFEPRVRGNGHGSSFKMSAHDDGDIKFAPKFGSFGQHKASG